MVWAARAIPAVLIGIIGYVSWVVTRVVVCKTSSRWLLVPGKRLPLTTSDFVRKLSLTLNHR